MKLGKRIILSGTALLLAAGLASAACAEPGVFSPRIEYEYLVGSTLWQLSAESQALIRQAFACAQSRIAQMTELCLDESEPAWQLGTDDDGGKVMLHDGRRVAAICDIDDTLVDGAHYTANIIGANGDYNNVAFMRFVLSDGCTALSGAVEFANACVESGIELYYLTNRSDLGYKIGQSDSAGGYPDAGGGLYFAADGSETGTTILQELGMSAFDITLKRMRELGFPIDEQHLILNDARLTGTTKEPARIAIREGTEDFPNGRRADDTAAAAARSIACAPHDVALMLGDQLSDFTDAFDAENMDAVERAAQTAEFAELWGNTWIVLPNAVYGRALDAAMRLGVSETFSAYDYTQTD